MKRWVIAEIVLIAAGLSGPLARAADSSPMRPEAAIASNGDVAELENLLAAGKITALRRTLNGSYGASLSYYPDEMIYYAALFQQSNIWRVFKTQNDARAETVYADFAKTSNTLADAEIKRIKLEAEKAYADRQIAAQQARANRLQADLDIARAQQNQVTSYQVEQQNAIRELRTEQAAAQAQLRALQIRVQELQKQSDGDLPVPPK
jgi:Zn-dependent M16 (insulinase) family peptidase